MPKQKINKFLGYTTKVDEIVGQPGLAVTAQNCMIHQGDLVNLPSFLVLSNLNLPFNSQYSPLGIYKQDNKDYILVRTWSSSYPHTYLYHFVFVDGVLVAPTGNQIFIPYDLINLKEYQRQQLIQIGDFLGVLGDTGLKEFQVDSEIKEKYGLPEIYITPQMACVTRFDNFKGVPLGVHAPYLTSSLGPSSGIGNGPLIGSYELALTIVHPVREMPLNGVDGADQSPQWVGGYSSYMPAINLESNLRVAEEGVEIFSGQRYVTFKVFLHPEIKETVANKQGGLTVGIYARKTTETNFNFIGYWNTGGVDSPGPNSTTVKYGLYSSTEGADFTYTSQYGLSATSVYGLYYYQFTVDLLNTWADFNVTKDVPVLGLNGNPTLGSHNVPKPSFHCANFKNRMYYAKMNSNVLQYSMRTPLGVEETGAYSQYIEGEEPIGNSGEPITGVTEFLGQLIIFKENQTWVLTGDIFDQESRLRILFSDIGCTNDGESRSYLVFLDVLYWVSRVNYYRYTGSERPVPISQPIEKDLEGRGNQDTFISSNERYGLIYFSEVPYGAFNAIRPALVYNHYNGTWTTSSLPFYDIKRLSPSFQIGMTQENMHYISSVENPSFMEQVLSRETIRGRYDIQWKSSEFDFAELGRIKWWKFLRLVGEYETGTIIIRNGKGDIITQKDLKDIADLVKIGRFSDRLTVEYYEKNFASVPNVVEPFRIRELQLEATVKGRH